MLHQKTARNAVQCKTPEIRAQDEALQLASPLITRSVLEFSEILNWNNWIRLLLTSGTVV